MFYARPPTHPRRGKGKVPTTNQEPKQATSKQAIKVSDEE
jgi:hypothetical protein